jgi:hypothetical protein
MAYISVLDSHQSLITVLSIFFVKFIYDSLVHSNIVYSFLLCNLECIYLNIDLGTQGSEVGIKSLLASHRVMWVENIKGLQVKLIPASDHF